MSTTVVRPTYGNWIKQRSPGIGGIGLLGVAIGIGGAVISLLTLLSAGMRPALIVLGIVVVTFGLFGTPLGVILAEFIGFLRSRNARETQWRSGVFSFNKDASVRLPGILGSTTLLSRADTFGNSFAVVKAPQQGGLYTIVARCMSEGSSMQDQERLNNWVAGYAGVLSMASQEPGLICAKAISDTAPDPGGRLSSQVLAQRSREKAPAIASAVMDEIIASYPSAASDNATYVEFTFRGRNLSRRGKDAEVLSELARKVPGILGALERAGGGTVEMMSPEILTKTVRASYDPASQKYIEQSELAGHAVEIPWQEAGPVASQEAWDHLRHDSGVSVTWEMREPPRSAVNELSLSGILAPHRDFVRKRVALIYRPHSPEESMRKAESDASTASFVASNTKKKVTASAKMAIRATEQTRDEVAAGHALVRFSMLVTATVASEADLPQAVSTIEGRAGASQLRLRRSYGSQASGFAATLPVGFVPWEHTVIPTKVAELI